MRGPVNIFAVWPQASRGASPRAACTGRVALCDTEVYTGLTPMLVCPGQLICELVLSPSVWELMAQSWLCYQATSHELLIFTNPPEAPGFSCL